VIGVVTPTGLAPGGGRRTLTGACLGNAVEWYDFAVYGAFSTVLARAFLPTGGRAALAAIFAVFATSFLARPLGAVIMGRRADHLGRRPALSRTITLMTFATAAIALLPTWSMAGPLAPALLLLVRLGQGFAVGGEVPSSVAFLVESAPAGRRGRYGGWHMAGIATGMAGGYGIAALLCATLSDSALLAWGWRVAFLIAAPLGSVARYIRRRLAETRSFEAVPAPAPPRLADVLRGRSADILRAVALVAALAVAFNLWFVFLPAHVVVAGVVSLTDALSIGLVGLITAAVSAALSGRLSDRLGRRKVLIGSTLALAASAMPGLALAGGSPGGLLVSNVVMGLLIGTLTVTAFVAELFPTPVRATGTALTYGVATAVFGGTTPLIATILDAGGISWAVSCCLIVVAVLASAAAFSARETAFDPLR
jgi:MFS transporter, MHS family, proline/betaine transporter